jgi:hypothetical protein
VSRYEKERSAANSKRQISSCSGALVGAEQATLASWMSGYFNASKNVATVDLRKAERNLKVVARYCKIHKKETLMNAVQKKAR